MKIAYFAWGSLLWDSEGLDLQTNWKKTNLRLPLNFSRISDNGKGRLTLVIDNIDGVSNPIYYAITKETNLNNAIENLKSDQIDLDYLSNILDCLKTFIKKMNFSDEKINFKILNDIMERTLEFFILTSLSNEKIIGNSSLVFKEYSLKYILIFWYSKVRMRIISSNFRIYSFKLFYKSKFV